MGSFARQRERRVSISYTVSSPVMKLGKFCSSRQKM